MANQVDFTALVSSVDFSTVITALVAVAAAVVGVLLARRGIRWILVQIDDRRYYGRNG